VREFDRPRRFVTVTDYGSSPFVTVNTFEQDGDGTICQIEGDVVTRAVPRPLRPVWWILSPFLGPIIDQGNRRMVALVQMALEPGATDR
jgi:hypothetical protein